MLASEIVYNPVTVAAELGNQTMFATFGLPQRPQWWWAFDPQWGQEASLE
jgi:hypothetical protein